MESDHHGLWSWDMIMFDEHNNNDLSRPIYKYTHSRQQWASTRTMDTKVDTLSPTFNDSLEWAWPLFSA